MKEEYEIGDNMFVQVVARERHTFDLAMEIGFMYIFGEDIEYYAVHPDYGFVLFSSKPSNCDKFDVQKLPSPMDCGVVSDFIWNWLHRMDKDLKYDMAKESNLDHDGSSHMGFNIYNEEWVRVGDVHGAFLAIKPHWIWCGK